ncbi:MAG: dihydroorotase [Spirochaetota bacterium]
MSILIKNGRMIDPASSFDGNRDILVENGVIAKIAEKIDAKADTVIDAAGCLVLPGLFDMHVHFREPGREDQETILGGSAVAAKGGYTSVCPMPNTNPPIDNQALVRFIKLEAEKGPINVFPVATVTKGRKGEEISEMGDLLDAGAVAFSDDGSPVANPLIMRRALDYARMFDAVILAHEEDQILADGGSMNEGVHSTQLGIKGIPSESEEVMIARDVILARMTGGRIHVQHTSAKGSIDEVRAAKKSGVKITCETAPHYFTLTDAAVQTHLSMAKMNPPLRTEDDRRAVIEGLRDGTIDVIATDHAPHLAFEKKQEIDYAPFGIVGLETAVPLIITKLVKEEKFSYTEAFAKVTCNPCRILKIDRGTLAEGKAADITIINPEKKVSISEDFLISQCKNSPFIGMDLSGSVEYTICGGKIVYHA